MRALHRCGSRRRGRLSLRTRLRYRSLRLSLWAGQWLGPLNIWRLLRSILRHRRRLPRSRIWIRRTEWLLVLRRWIVLRYACRLKSRTGVWRRCLLRLLCYTNRGSWRPWSRRLILRCQRPGRHQSCWFGLAAPSKLRRIGCRLPCMLNLSSHWRCSRIVNHCKFLRGRSRVRPTRAAVIADSAAALIRNGRVVDIVNHCDVHIVHGAVVIQVPLVPIRSVVTAACVSITVVDPTVKADMGTPIAGMAQVMATLEVPPRWSPKSAYVRREHPSTRNPIVAIVGIAPTPRRPNIIVAGSGWLVVRK